MNTNLFTRDFKWEVIRARRPITESFVNRDYLEASELAMKQLPDDEFLTEVVVEMDCFRKDGNNHLETFIYWRLN